MDIKDLPPKIAKLASRRKEEYKKLHNGKTYFGYGNSTEMAKMFEWNKTPEKEIWNDINYGNYVKLYIMYPHLREEYIEEPQIVNNYEIF